MSGATVTSAVGVGNIAALSSASGVVAFIVDANTQRVFYADALVGSGDTASAQLPAIASVTQEKDPQQNSTGRVILTLTPVTGSADAASPTRYVLGANAVVGYLSAASTL